MHIAGAHIGFEVSDLARALAFWTPLLEAATFSKVFGDDRTHAGYLNGPLVLVIGLSETPRVRRSAPTGEEFVVTDHVGLHLTSREDVDAVAAAMAAAGHTPLFPAQEYPEFGPGFYAVTFCDPDHNVIEFATRPQR